MKYHPRTVLMNEHLIRPLRSQSENRDKNKLWLDKNENRDPQYLQFLEKMFQEIAPDALHTYPDCFYLYEKLSHFLSVDIEELFIAAGSDGVIRSVYESFVCEGEVVAYPNPTFAMYEIYSKIYDAKIELLDYTPSDEGPLLSADSILHAIRQKKIKLLCLPNPNSPTGTIFLEKELETIIKTAEDFGTIVLIDEAYYPFHPMTALPWIHQYSNLIIARTFSKAWGLAGIRLGYAIANQDLIKVLHKMRPMYEAGALSFAIAEKVLNYNDLMMESVNRLNEGKHYFLTEMKKMNFHTFPAEGNFFHVSFDRYVEKIHKELEKHVLYRRDFHHPSLKGYSRFTATTREAFLPIVNAITEVAK